MGISLAVVRAEYYPLPTGGRTDDKQVSQLQTGRKPSPETLAFQHARVFIELSGTVVKVSR